MSKEKTSKSGLTPELLSELKKTFESGEDFKKNMNKAIGMIGNAGKYDRIHVFEIENNMAFSLLYEWNVASLSPLPDKLKRYRYLHDRLLAQQLENKSYIVVNETDELSNPAIKPVMSMQECKQMIIIPLFESSTQLAFISFMHCHPKGQPDEKELSDLVKVSSILAKYMNEYYKHEALQKQDKNIMPFMQLLRTVIFYPELKRRFPEADTLEEHIAALDKIMPIYAE